MSSLLVRTVGYFNGLSSASLNDGSTAVVFSQIYAKAACGISLSGNFRLLVNC
ncbi:MAG: hypothetical protein ACXV8X_10205 [Candidatus Angelobacter sp.]